MSELLFYTGSDIGCFEPFYFILLRSIFYVFRSTSIILGSVFIFRFRPDGAQQFTCLGNKVMTVYLSTISVGH